MTGVLEGKVVIVTGAGRGIGRGEALEFARQGASVVVNDLGPDVDGKGRSSDVAEAVVEEITSAGGVAIANAEDVADWDGSRRVMESALEVFGHLDILVNNAGILRDRTVANMSIEEWDDVIRVHLRGTFVVSRPACRYWRAQAKELSLIHI